MKISEIFEGKNSSLRKTFDNATKSSASNLKEEILKEARKQIYAIIGLEKDLDGEDNKLLITNEDDEVLEAIDFTQEINDIVKFISLALDKQHKADMEEVKKIVEGIDDNGGGSGRRLKIQLLNKLKDV